MLASLAKPLETIVENVRSQQPEITMMEEEEDDGLFNILLSGTASTLSMVTDWVREYSDDPYASMTQMIQLLLDAAACPGQVHKSALQDPDSITDALEQLQQLYLLEETIDYPLQRKGRKIKKSFGVFWETWIKQASAAGLLYTDDSCLESLSDWLGAMSSSPMQPLRHVATAASLNVMTALCGVVAAFQAEYVTLNRQLTLDSAKNAKDLQVKVLKERVDELVRKKAAVENALTGLFDGVFVHRYRDSDSLIRSECLIELGAWIRIYPDVYLDSQFLRYLGWMLSDKVFSVRLEATKALCSLYESQSLLFGLGPFTERFKVRLFQMAVSEESAPVRHEAAKTVCAMALGGLLEETDISHIVPLIIDTSETTQSAIAPYVAEYIKQDMTESLSNDLLIFKKHHKDVDDDWTKADLTVALEIKAFVQLVLNSYDLSGDRLKACHANLVEKNHQDNPKVDPLDDDLPEMDRIHGTTLAQDYVSIVQLATRSKDDDKLHEFQNMGSVVKALWKHLPCLANDRVMCKLAQGPFEDDDEPSKHPLLLSHRERATLLYTLSASLHVLSDSKHRETFDLGEFVGEFTKLLKTNAHPYLISSFAHLVRSIDLTFLAQSHTFDQLVSDCSNFYQNSNGTHLMEELAKTLELFTTGRVYAVDGSKNQTTTLNTTTAQTVFEDMVQTLLTETVDHLEQLREEIQINTFVAFGVCLTRLRCLASRFPLFSYDCCQTLRFGTVTGLEQVLYISLELIVSEIKSLQDASSIYCSEMSLPAYRCLMDCVDLMVRNVLESLASQTANKNGVHSEELSQNVDRLIKILEGILVGTADTNIRFSIANQAKIMEQLMVLYGCVNGVSSNLYPELCQRPPGDVQTVFARVLDRLVQLVVFQDPYVLAQMATEYEMVLPEWVFNPETRDEGLVLRDSLLTLTFMTKQMIVQGTLLPEASIPIFKYVGLDMDSLSGWLSNSHQKETDDEGHVERPLLSILAPVCWNEFAAPLYKDTVGDLSVVLEAYLSDGASEHRLKHAHLLIKSICITIRESVSQSMDLFIMGQVPNLDGSLALVKGFIGQMKKWLSTMSKVEKEAEKSKRLFRVYFVLSRELLVMMAQLGERLAVRMYIHSQTRKSTKSKRRLSEITNFTSFQSSFFVDDTIAHVSMDEGTTCLDQDKLVVLPGFDMISSLDGLGQCWNVLATLGACVHTIITGLPPLTVEELENHTTSVPSDGWTISRNESSKLSRVVPLNMDQVIEFVTNVLESFELDPEQDEWKFYEDACQVIKGHSVAKTKKKRVVKSKKLSSDLGSEMDDATPRPKKQRKVDQAMKLEVKLAKEEAKMRKEERKLAKEAEKENKRKRDEDDVMDKRKSVRLASRTSQSFSGLDDSENEVEADLFDEEEEEGDGFMPSPVL